MDSQAQREVQTEAFFDGVDTCIHCLSTYPDKGAESFEDAIQMLKLLRKGAWVKAGGH